MDLLFGLAFIFSVGYIAGSVVTNARRNRRAALPPVRRCATCNYCFQISEITKSLMYKTYSGKLGCHMCRGSTVPVGYTGTTISVVDPDSFCDRWKERVEDG